jgi:hypothetical protein
LKKTDTLKRTAQKEVSEGNRKREPGMVVNACDPSYLGGTGRRIPSLGPA